MTDNAETTAPETGATTATEGGASSPSSILGTENAQTQGQQAANLAQTPALTPESYGDFTLPEGLEANDEILGDFKAAAAEFGLNKDQAQRLVDLQSKVANEVAEHQNAVYNEIVSGWAKQAAEDKEIGGTAHQECLGVARGAVEKFATPEMISFMNETGFGNHPEMVRLFYRIGKAMGDDNMVGGGGGAAEGLSTADVLYPTMVKGNR